MPIRHYFALFCLIAGLAVGALGLLVVIAQTLEWWSFGNWNPVSLRYVLDYFTIRPPHFVPMAGKIWDLPANVVLLVVGALIATIGGKHWRQRTSADQRRPNGTLGQPRSE
jgi:hypothetical protein